jgi:hypothetical protein
VQVVPHVVRHQVPSTGVNEVLLSANLARKVLSNGLYRSYIFELFFRVQASYEKGAFVDTGALFFRHLCIFKVLV